MGGSEGARKAWRTAALAAALLSGTAAAARAAVTISDAPTKHMHCVADECGPTAPEAVLNATELQAMLAAASVTVTSGPSAQDIVVAAPLGWTSGVTLTLDAWRSLTIDKPVSVTGVGGFTVLTNDGGTGGLFAFGSKGKATFASRSSPLTINAKAYTLVRNIAALARGVARNPGGLYALADSYDASADGTYPAAAIPMRFTGTLEGLGNAISKLRIDDRAKTNQVGLFADLEGTVENLALVEVDIRAARRAQVGGFAGYGIGATLTHDSVTGAITAEGKSIAGGLLGISGAAITYSYATASVSIGQGYAGGLVGDAAGGGISQSFATGAVRVGKDGQAGGLIGHAQGSPVAVSNSYATGAVSARDIAYAGGLVGDSLQGSFAESYAAGPVSGAADSVGGFAGVIWPGVRGTDCYWDTTSSGLGKGTARGNLHGLGGLTTSEFQSGLPAGFDPAIWAETATLNGGRPYLRANPPP